MENIKINKQDYEMHSLDLLSTDDSTIQVFLMKQNSKLDSIGLEIIKDKAETFLVFKDLETYKNTVNDIKQYQKDKTNGNNTSTIYSTLSGVLACLKTENGKNVLLTTNDNNNQISVLLSQKQFKKLTEDLDSFGKYIEDNNA
jgi:hypothetical protein